jgi:AcrR family transcriptional regulator
MGLKERREREIEERRRQILDAARTVLFESGMQGASINRIAKMAELGVGTIYSYFKSKEDIFIDLQEEGLSLLADAVQEAAASAERPADKIRKIVRAYLDFSTQHKNYFAIINYFLSSPDIMFTADLKRQVHEHGSRILSHVVAAVQTGVQQGVFKPVDADRYAVMLWANMNGLIQFKKLENTILIGNHYDDLCEYAIERLIDILLLETRETR